MTGCAFQAGYLTTLAKEDAGYRENTKNRTPCKKSQEDNYQRSLPSLIEKEMKIYGISILDGKHQQKRKNDEPYGPSKCCHGIQ